MSQSNNRGLSPRQLQMFVLGWFGLSAVAAICVFAGILFLFGGSSTGGKAQATRRPTATAPVVTAPTIPVVATQPAAVQSTPTDSGQPLLHPLVPDTDAFGLGGQIQSYDAIPHREQMFKAGMSWVKFQIVWKPGLAPDDARELIQLGHNQGFKVLISLKGELNPTSINYDEYIKFIKSLMGRKPDALEVWNEMNFDREWPANDINGASYVNKMLIPAYNLIKEKNPGTLVITGAPTPTGAFGGGCGSFDTPAGKQVGCDDILYIQQMRDAGAGSYADCIGVHFNAGATPPSATTGHPSDDGRHHYSWYYQPMVDLYYNTFNKPLCFTELGYVSSEGFGAPPPNFPWATQITLADQAQWLGETVSMAARSGKVRLVSIWNVDFPSDAPDDPKSMYAIIRPDGSCPACAALWTTMTAP